MIKISCTESSTRIPTVKHNFMNRERKRKSNILDKIQSFLIKEILSFIISAPFANERRQILNNFSCSFISNSTLEWRFFPPCGKIFKTFGVSTAQRTSRNDSRAHLEQSFLITHPNRTGMYFWMLEIILNWASSLLWWFSPRIHLRRESFTAKVLFAMKS